MWASPTECRRPTAIQYCFFTLLGNHITINMNMFLTVFNKYYLNRIKVGIYPKVKINVWFITKSIFLKLKP